MYCFNISALLGKYTTVGDKILEDILLQDDIYVSIAVFPVEM